MKLNTAVKDRYSYAAKKFEPGLCCPAVYDSRYLKIIPEEVIERDYGCGDPSPYIKAGETVLDLGSGGGKLCFIAAQIVGEEGRVIGVDINDDMLELARRAAPQVSEKLGYANVEFRKGHIENLRLNQERVGSYLKGHPIRNARDLEIFREMIDELESGEPLIADDSIDVIVSNCVLNLVSPELKLQLFHEIYRLLKPGGRVVISDVVSDEDVPLHLQENEKLWSGCYTGAIREDRFLDAFVQTGMYGVELLKRDEKPWAVIEDIEFRNVTLSAYKGKEGPCWDHLQAVVYKGPFKNVEDDDGHVLSRGHRMAVCEKTFKIFSRPPYSKFFDLIEPNRPVDPKDVKPFDSFGNTDSQKGVIRHEN